MVPPNKKPRKNKEGDSYARWEKLYNKTIASFKNIQLKLTDHEHKISGLQDKWQSNGEVGHGLSELKTSFESSKGEYQKHQKYLKKLPGSLVKNYPNTKTLERKAKKLETENRKLKQKIKSLEKKIKSLEKEIKKLQGRVTVLESKVKELKKKPLNSLTIALLQIGQVFTEIQNKMYKHVLPALYNPKVSYKVDHILQDIQENAKARKRWAELQHSLKWNNSFGRAMRNFSGQRNDKAHPKIKEAALKKYVLVLDKAGYLKRSPSLWQVNRIIGIWKKLKTKRH